MHSLLQFMHFKMKFDLLHGAKPLKKNDAECIFCDSTWLWHWQGVDIAMNTSATEAGSSLSGARRRHVCRRSTILSFMQKNRSVCHISITYDMSQIQLLPLSKRKTVQLAHVRKHFYATLNLLQDNTSDRGRSSSFHPYVICTYRSYTKMPSLIQSVEMRS